LSIRCSLPALQRRVLEKADLKNIRSAAETALKRLEITSKAAESGTLLWRARRLHFDKINNLII